MQSALSSHFMRNAHLVDVEAYVASLLQVSGGFADIDSLAGFVSDFHFSQRFSLTSHKPRAEIRTLPSPRTAVR